MHIFQIHKSISKYELYSNTIDTQAAFTRTEMNNEKTLNFLQNSHFGVETGPSNVSICKSTAKIHILIGWEAPPRYFFVYLHC